MVGAFCLAVHFLLHAGQVSMVGIASVVYGVGFLVKRRMIANVFFANFYSLLFPWLNISC